MDTLILANAMLFLSTLSLRRATDHVLDGGRKQQISIHALLAESDLGIVDEYHAHRTFLSTLSLRRATRNIPKLPRAVIISIHALLAESDALRRDKAVAMDISIHALLAESDPPKICAARWNTNFYPRSPCGERLMYPYQQLSQSVFLSTLSLRRATTQPCYKCPDRCQFLSTLSLRRATHPW